MFTWKVDFNNLANIVYEIRRRVLSLQIDSNADHQKIKRLERELNEEKIKSQKTYQELKNLKRDLMLSGIFIKKV